MLEAPDATCGPGDGAGDGRWDIAIPSVILVLAFVEFITGIAGASSCTIIEVVYTTAM